MRVIILIICLLSAQYQLRAEGLIFADSVWNFGKIAEDGGVQSHSFPFRNGGKRPVVIHNVRTSCGCTSVKYSQQPITGGGESTIEVEYDPRNRPGMTSKDIYIYSSASGEPIRLRIEGWVNARVRPVEDRYPYILSQNVRLGRMYSTISGVSEGELAQTAYEFINASDRGVEIELRPRQPREMLKLFYTSTLAPGEEMVAEVGYYLEAKDLPSGGEKLKLRDTLDIYINGEWSSKSLYIKGY